MLSIMAVAGGRGRGLWRRRREFLMGSLNGKVFTLPAVATAATALHDSTYVFLRIRVHSTCYKCHAHTHSPYTHTHRDSRSGNEKARRCCCKCNWPKVPSVRVEERDFSLLPREMLTRFSSPSPCRSSPSPLTTGQRVCCVDWNVSPARAI